MSQPTKAALKVREILKKYGKGINPLEVAPPIRGGMGRGSAKEGRKNIARNIWD